MTKLQEIIRKELQMQLHERNLPGKLKYKITASDGSVIKVQEIPNPDDKGSAIVQVFKDGNKVTWASVKKLVPEKKRSEIEKFIKGENIENAGHVLKENYERYFGKLGE